MGGFFYFKENNMAESTLGKKFELGRNYLQEALGQRRGEFVDMIQDAARTDPLYKPTLIHPEHLLGILLTTNELSPDLFSGSNAALQEQIFQENFGTIVTMLPDIVTANHQLRKAGFTYTENPFCYITDYQALTGEADQYAEVIQQTYPNGTGGTRYPLKQKNPQAIIDDVGAGKFHMYTVHNPIGETVAVFGTVIREDILGKKGYAVELGRTGIRADKTAELNNVPVRGVSKLRLYHLLTDPRFIADPEIVGKSASFIYSDIRLAQTWNDEFSGGQGVQSVFFGGRKYGENLGFGFSSVGWRYNLERTEPFLFIFKPTFPESYRTKLTKKTLFVPDSKDAERISNFLLRTFGATPEILHNGTVLSSEVLSSDGIQAVVSFTPTDSNGQSDIFAKVDIVDTDDEFRQKATGVIPTVSLADAIQIAINGNVPFVEVYVDATLGDGVNQERITGIVSTLKQLGFVCNGWVPSNRGNGDAIQISYARLGPGANNPVSPDMPEKYYEGDLTEVRNEALQIFQELSDSGPIG